MLLLARLTGSAKETARSARVRGFALLIPALLVTAVLLKPVAAAPRQSAAELGTAFVAKILCSGVFISRRNIEETLHNTATRMVAGYYPQSFTDISLDPARKRITLSFENRIERSAKYYGSQGCIIDRPGVRGIDFMPVQVVPAPSLEKDEFWPYGESNELEQAADGVDIERIERAIEMHFLDQTAWPLSFLVVHDGMLIAERYVPMVSRETALDSWSMGKSVAASLLGVLVQRGWLDVLDAAPIEEWQGVGDPRSGIRIIDLLRMSSGLRFSQVTDAPSSWGQDHADHLYVYSGAVDVFEFAVGKPSEFPPDSIGRYRNSDPLIIGRIMRDTVTDHEQDYLTFPQRALFDPLGIQNHVLETDPYGNFILSGSVYGSARDWARLALLYLWDGRWKGEQILPSDWSSVVRTPAPAWSSDGKKGIYGGFFWLNTNGRWSLPEDTYYMSGSGVNVAFIVPSLDLVIVRMGLPAGRGVMEPSLNKALSEIVVSLPKSERL